MRTQQRCWSKGRWESNEQWTLGDSAHLVLAFGARAILSDSQPMDEVRKAHPRAEVIGCSTAGEISGTNVLDDSLVVTAISFSDTSVRVVSTDFADASDSFAAGARLAESLKANDLVHVLILSDGLMINGSDLVRGLVETLPPGVAVTGGLSGDGSKFEKTAVFHNGKAKDRVVVGLGLYGSRLRVGYGSLGGWDPFGPERLVTKSKRNVLYELDGESALGLYKRYLGAHAATLPASGLLFPLCVRPKLSDVPVVRTILSVDESEQSMTFAGDIAQGSYARLMRANFERLLDGATTAATRSTQTLRNDSAELALLISCVGRKLILKQRTEEEVEAVRNVVGPRAAMTGFYSYGEISPFQPNARCELHNQTMTITVFSEAA